MWVELNQNPMSPSLENIEFDRVIVTIIGKIAWEIVYFERLPDSDKKMSIENINLARNIWQAFVEIVFFGFWFPKYSEISVFVLHFSFDL